MKTKHVRRFQRRFAYFYSIRVFKKEKRKKNLIGASGRNQPRILRTLTNTIFFIVNFFFTKIKIRILFLYFLLLEGWSGHPVCRKRYHFIIRSESENSCERACGSMLLQQQPHHEDKIYSHRSSASLLEFSESRYQLSPSLFFPFYVGEFFMGFYLFIYFIL